MTERESEFATPNPVHDAFNISVLVPEEITIRMVDASALADYEIWFFLSSLLSSAFIGFSVAYIQASNNPADPLARPLFWISAMFGLLFIVSFIMAIAKRSLLRRRGRTMKLKTSVVSPTD